MSRRNLRSRLLPPVLRVVRAVPPQWIRASRPLVHGLLAGVPGWKRQIREGMDCLLGDAPDRSGQVDRYFDHLATMLIHSARVARSGLAGSGLAACWSYDPAAERAYRQALDQGRGCVMAGAHLIGSEILAGLVNAEHPVAVLVRKSPDPGYEALKSSWYTSLGVEVIHRPPRGAGMAELMEVTLALRALRKNRILAITPDLISRPGKGVAVEWFGRELHLPAGAFFLGMRTDSAVIPSYFVESEGSYRVLCDAPLKRVEGDTQAAVRSCAQEWATSFEGFLRRHPDMWQFWLDKRWRRWMGLES